jgi:hypothetical protein
VTPSIVAVRAAFSLLRAFTASLNNQSCLSAASFV